MTSARSTTARQPSEIAVLVVDDCVPVIAVVRAVLGQLGLNDVDEAGDGTAALLRLRERRYDLVISDWSMEPMSGYELLRSVRADPALRTTPFVMMTTRTQADRLLRARQAGVNECILKPFGAAALRAKIAAVCGLDEGTGPVTGGSVAMI